MPHLLPDQEDAMPERFADQLAAIVTAVDVVAEDQGASTGRGTSRQYDLALEALEVAEWRMHNAAKLDTVFTDPHHWGDPEPDDDEQETS